MKEEKHILHFHKSPDIRGSFCFTLLGLDFSIYSTSTVANRFTEDNMCFDQRGSISDVCCCSSLLSTVYLPPTV